LNIRSLLSALHPTIFFSVNGTMNTSTKLGILLVLIAAAVYQGILKTTLFVTLGVGREVQPISDFPAYQCRRIHDPKLQACEDMWLSEETRQLFLACSSSEARSQWMPKSVLPNDPAIHLDPPLTLL
jgi:hypothetical protein